MTDLRVELGERSYPVLFRHDAEAEAAERIQALAQRVLVVSDSTVADLYAARFTARLRQRGLHADLLVFPAGEAHKTLSTLGGLYDAAFAAGLDRSTIVVALGGGVVGDLAGFLAATLLRGIGWVQLPTTLLAQVDSSVGGKTGVNHAAGKNLIGAFHQPRLVLVDTRFLSTLPAREVRAGMAEALKHGAVAEPDLLSFATSAGAALEAGQPEALLPLISAAVAVKARIVAADEHEAGIRAILNFGHTLGHAIEGAEPGRLRHGEAVALGMAYAAERSQARGWLTPAERARFEQALVACGLDIDWRPWITPAVLDKVANDKKIRGEYLSDVLLHGLGHAQIVSVPVEEWRQTARALAGGRVEA